MKGARRDALSFLPVTANISSWSSEGSLVDVAHKWGADAVDEELIRLIERRARNGELDPDEQEEIWKASVRAYTARRREQIRAEWREYHQGQAERHSRTLEELVARHTTSTKRGEGALANE